MMLKRFRIELLRVTNKATKKTSYYVSKCGTFQRISREDYYRRYDDADGFECISQKSTKNHTREYITAIYEYESMGGYLY